MQKNNDNRFLEGLAQGNEKIIKEIYSKVYPKVQSFVLSNKGMVEDALDIFHDALLYVIVTYKEGKLKINSFEAYLFVICKNLWKRSLKKRVIKTDFGTLEDKTTDISLFILEQECFDFYIEKFQLLSPNCKEILSNYFNGWDYEEIVKELQYASVNTVRQRVFKCKTKLTQLIKNDKRYQRIKRWKII